MSVRLADIAKKMNISVAATSLAINNKPGVSEATRKRVLELCDEMGYKYTLPAETDGKAGDQPSEQNSSILLWICKKHGSVLGGTQFFLALLEGIENSARRNGYDLVYSSCKIENITPQTVNERANKPGVAGMIILATELFDADLEPFIKCQKPLVILDADFSNLKCNSVLMDNINGTTQIVQYLIDCGHTLIGHLKSKVYIKNFGERELGYKNTLQANGLSLENSRKFEVLLDPTMEGAYKDMCDALDAAPELPTAFFADNDIIAFGAMKALSEYGIAIPDRVSVVGFDDIPSCEIVSPRLSTVKVFKQNMGEMAIAILMLIIASQANDEFMTVRTGTTIITRDSVAQLKR